MCLIPEKTCCADRDPYAVPQGFGTRLMAVRLVFHTAAGFSGVTLCILVVAALTFAYFGPSNSLFASGPIEEAAVAAKLNQWLVIHDIRIALAIVAAILGCLAIRT